MSSERSNSSRSGSDTENDDVFEIEYILDKWFTEGSDHLLVKWKGYPYSEATYVPASDVSATELLEQFNSVKGYNWLAAKNSDIIKIEGTVEVAGPLHLVATFKDLPQPIIIHAREAKRKFDIAKEYCEANSIVFPRSC